MHGKNKKIVCIFISEYLAVLNSAKVTKKILLNSIAIQKLFRKIFQKPSKNYSKC